MYGLDDVLGSARRGSELGIGEYVEGRWVVRDGDFYSEGVRIGLVSQLVREEVGMVFGV